MKSVAVYCGSALGNHPHYAQAAASFGALLAQRGLRLVYGGGNIGLMGQVADAALAHGGQVTGVIPHQLANLEMAHQGLQQLETVETMAQRKTRMEELADAFVALPGGVGTLEELAEVLTLQQLGNLQGPVALLNVDGFWDPFVEMFASFVQRGFMQRRYVDGLIVESDPQRLLDRCADFKPLGAKWES
ncbi:TIGR00730 family Rossman fold protein [Corynebacterium lizhenjunii]|uniref:Cytokinin riboside 5'-monophosphate phosphoribohydrolase n=1 Tax=Corynebacterium lizhenjunii TaxID=2709394 RepID=A0A7T0KEC1_9CORY|nr:TIGR00730 family Rossman fold protein [Corynebacterium lizhenjunii]QPK79235.1 TIGR00730 family Rossman fold protein [Corynebacterium lizhenjunii]